MKDVSTRDISKVHEENVAKVLRGHRTPNSGAASFAKGDVVAGEVLLECKTKMSETSSFSIQKNWLEVLEKERIEMRKKVAALAFSFDAGMHSYYIIDEKTMKYLVESINNDC